MDVRCHAVLSSEPAGVLRALFDLGTYPRWLSIVGGAAPLPARPDGTPAWLVDLVGRVGPFTRSKRVQMVRTAADEADGLVRFERCEDDGRDHNPWVLTARAQGRPGGGTVVTVDIHYGGPSWIPGIDRLLAQEARRAGARLDAVVNGTPPG